MGAHTPISTMRVAGLAPGLILLGSAAASAAPFAYLTNSGTDNVTPIDIATTFRGTPIPVGEEPIGIAITPDQGSIILANRALDAIAGGLTEVNFMPGSIGSGRI